jgi:aminoglycoside phosphotransferase (APT) family kinase protein
VGFTGAPRLLGIDERHREILSYIPGETVARAPAHLSDARLVSAALLVRGFYDPTAGTALVADQEIVCHGDLGSHNIIFDGDKAVGLIDWDEGVAPGSRLVDFAHAVWCCADVCEPEVDVAEQPPTVRLMCDAYRWPDQAAIINEITARFRRARDTHAAGGRVKASTVFEAMIARMQRNDQALKS